MLGNGNALGGTGMSFAWTVEDGSSDGLPFGTDPVATHEPGERTADTGSGAGASGTGTERPRQGQHGAHARRSGVGARAGRLFSRT